ncbi:hypothetical protein M9H77_30535 [Catharanthus roseus]|uniref:Uncharacterized protein n=1 Tax=Catharanthus roseus TaxID=4058 RepID=A0ACC0A1U0_CATRO|nr:hypothetical protein M9H77_30535 [Catharanthus roseus]
MIQNLHIIQGKNGAIQRSKLGRFVASKSREGISLYPTIGGRVDPTAGGRVLPVAKEFSLNLSRPNGNHNEGPSDPLMQEVDGTLRSLQQQMGNIERNVGVLSARVEKIIDVGLKKGFNNFDNLTPKQTMRNEDTSSHANFGVRDDLSKNFHETSKPPPMKQERRRLL